MLYRIFICPLLATITAGSSASAQVGTAPAPLSEPVPLPPVMITADRSLSPLANPPYTTAAVDQKTFQEQGYRTLPDAFRDTPGVLVQKTAHGHGSPFIRGFTGRQNLMLIDGIRFNNSVFRSGPIQYWNTIDPYSLDRIELIKGQGGVQYGSDAVGGTVNAITLGSGFLDEQAGEDFWHGSVLGRYETNSQSWVSRVQTSIGRGEAYGLTLGATVKEFGDIRDSSVGRMEGTGYPEQDFDVKLEYAPDSETLLTLAYQYVNQDDISRWHSTVNNPGWVHGGHVAAPGTWLARDYDQERSLAYARLEGRPAGGGTQYRATFSWQTFSDSEHQIRSRTDNRLQSTDVTTLGGALDLETAAGPGAFIYGADFYHDDVDSLGVRDGVVRPDFRPVADDSTYANLGVFAQYRWEPTDALRITLGGRYTHVEADLGRYYDKSSKLDSSGSRTWDNGAFSLRGVYEITPEWNIYGGASQSFRAPNLDDLSGNLTARSGSNSLGSLGLDPEEFINYEIGIRQRNAAWDLGLALFYTDINDVITGIPVAPGSSDTISGNGQDGYVYGVELEGGWRLHDQWRLSGHAAWQDGRATSAAYAGGPSEEQYISRLLPLSGGLSLRWTHPSDKVWVEARVTAFDNAGRLTAGDVSDSQRIPSGGTPGYVVAGLHTGWRVKDGVMLTASLENVTDEDYRHHGSGQNEAGFNAILGLKCSW